MKGKSMPARGDASEIPFYPDELLPRLQCTLATLADIEVRYEIERDYLESWSGPRDVKERLLAKLEQCRRADRERVVSRLEAYRPKRTGLEPATRGEPVTDKMV